MIEAATKGYLVFDKLEAMTSVCSVGLDMIAIPGDTPSDTIAGIIADEMAIGMINKKLQPLELSQLTAKQSVIRFLMEDYSEKPQLCQSTSYHLPNLYKEAEEFLPQFIV